MKTDDPELARLREIERKACSLRDRLKANLAFISDPLLLAHADELCRRAGEAVEAHLKRDTPSSAPATGSVEAATFLKLGVARRKTVALDFHEALGDAGVEGNRR